MVLCNSYEYWVKSRSIPSYIVNNNIIYNMLILYYVLQTFSRFIHILQAIHVNTDCTKVTLKPDNNIISISQSDKSYIQKKNEVLWTLKRKMGSAAITKKSLKALLKMEGHFVAESILRYLSKRMTSSPQNVTFHLALEKAEIVTQTGKT